MKPNKFTEDVSKSTLLSVFYYEQGRDTEDLLLIIITMTAHKYLWKQLKTIQHAVVRDLWL